MILFDDMDKELDLLEDTLLLEFKDDSQFVEEFKKYILSLMNNGIMDRKLGLKIIDLINDGVIRIGFQHNLFVRLLKLITRNIKVYITSTLGLQNRMPTLFGYYNYSDHRVYIILDSIKGKIDEKSLLYNIVSTLLHELVHYSHAIHFEKAEKIMTPIAKVFYYSVVRNINLWMKSDVPPSLLSNVICDYTYNFTKRVFNGELKTYKEAFNLLHEVLEPHKKMNLKVDFEKLVDWMEFIYSSILKTDRLIYQDHFRQSFYSAYINVFKPNMYLSKIEINPILFYQEFLIKSEIFSLVAPGLLMKNGIKNYVDSVKQLIEIA